MSSKKIDPSQFEAFHSTKEEVEQRRAQIEEDVKKGRYKFAFTDHEFILREELRPVRLQLELLRPELVLRDNEVNNAIVFFGSSKIPSLEVASQGLEEAKKALQTNTEDQTLQQAVKRAECILENSRYLQQAVRLAEIASNDDELNLTVFTGGGPSFMEAANEGAQKANARSVALNMILPHEQIPNPYVTPELTFQFHYFAIRKMHFLMRAKALAAFPGGFGTMDELFEVLTLIQTKKIRRIPLFLFHEKFWRKIVNFEGLVEEGTIRPEDVNLIRYVETAEDAWEQIQAFYETND